MTHRWANFSLKTWHSGLARVSLQGHRDTVRTEGHDVVQHHYTLAVVPPAGRGKKERQNKRQTISPTSQTWEEPVPLDTQLGTKTEEKNKKGADTKDINPSSGVTGVRSAEQELLLTWSLPRTHVN